MSDWDLFKQEVNATARTAEHSPNDAAEDLIGYKSCEWAALHAARVVQLLCAKGLPDAANNFCVALTKLVK